MSSRGCAAGRAAELRVCCGRCRVRFVPDRSGFLDLARRGRLAFVYREVLADTDTPVSAYAKLGRGPYSFLLESVVGGEKWAAYSFVGRASRAPWSARAASESRCCAPTAPASASPSASTAADPLRVRSTTTWRKLAPAVPPGLPRFFGGAVGWLGYDVVRSFERLPSTQARRPRAARALLRDHRHGGHLRQPARHASRSWPRSTSARRRRRRPGAPTTTPARASTRCSSGWRGPAPPLRPLRSRRRRRRRAAPPRADRDARGATRRACAASRSTSWPATPSRSCYSQRFEVAARRRRSVRRLPRAAGDQPVAVHVPPRVPRGGGHRRLARDAGARWRTARSRCGRSPGTRRRGATAEEDAALEAELRADPKELRRARHADRPRPQRRRARRRRPARCASTSVMVDRALLARHAPGLERARASCAPGMRPADVLRAAFPAGTLSGAPKIRAMEIIEELEPSRRGIYGGAVGYVSYTGNLDLAIAIRTLVTKGDTIYVQAGAGIVADSVPDGRVRGVRQQGARRAVARSRSRGARPEGELSHAARHRQLRLVHLQPGRSTWASSGRRCGSCATTRSRSTTSPALGARRTS